ncbi:MAG: hypothetical protein J6Q84_00430 [Kiritimatiellae bacterium]|nr:hypothetical protein [Kiritimatiellia bacterium]
MNCRLSSRSGIVVPATRIALSTVRDWLVEHESDMLVKFCCYESYEYDAYREVAQELGICC